jgi:hypothetical protein
MTLAPHLSSFVHHLSLSVILSPSPAVILSPSFVVILSEAKNLSGRSRVDSAKDLNSGSMAGSAKNLSGCSAACPLSDEGAGFDQESRNLGTLLFAFFSLLSVLLRFVSSRFRAFRFFGPYLRVSIASRSKEYA